LGYLDWVWLGIRCTFIFFGTLYSRLAKRQGAAWVIIANVQGDP